MITVAELNVECEKAKEYNKKELITFNKLITEQSINVIIIINVLNISIE